MEASFTVDHTTRGRKQQGDADERGQIVDERPEWPLRTFTKQESVTGKIRCVSDGKRAGPASGRS
jgi:hypothetical protein